MRRKWLKWVAWILLTPIILFVILMVLLYIPPVQNLIRKQATAIASEATGMDISVERIDLRFPLNLLVRGVQVIQPIQADKQISSVPGDSLAVKQVSDTLLTLESLNVRMAADTRKSRTGRGYCERSFPKLCRFDRGYPHTWCAGAFLP